MTLPDRSQAPTRRSDEHQSGTGGAGPKRPAHIEEEHSHETDHESKPLPSMRPLPPDAQKQRGPQGDGCDADGGKARGNPLLGKGHSSLADAKQEPSNDRSPDPLPRGRSGNAASAQYEVQKPARQ